MAAGDLITRDGQYEFSGLLFNGGPVQPFRMIQKVEGLWAVEMKTNDTDRQYGPGSFWGRDELAPKNIVLDLALLCNTKEEAHDYLEVIRGAWQPQTIEIPFVFRKTAARGKQMLYVRPRRLWFPTDAADNYGWMKGVGELHAADPIIYSLVTQQVAGEIPAGSTSDTEIPNNIGSLWSGVFAIIEIDGPTTNPRIQRVWTDPNSGGVETRTIALDLVLAAGETLVIDTFYKTVTKGNDTVDLFSSVRTDNQWWSLKPGNNTVTYSRANDTGTSNWRIKWQHGWA